MAAKKDNLPLSLNKDDDSTGTITYANEVIAIIAGVAANEVDGIAGMCTSGGISDVFGRNKNITKGVKVEIGSEEASVDLYVIVEYGTPIQTAALNVQENVRKAIETMTGLHVVRVDVHVQGVSFEKENKELQAGLDSAKLDKASEGASPAAAPRDPGKVTLVEDEEPAAAEETDQPDDEAGGRASPDSDAASGEEEPSSGAEDADPATTEEAAPEEQPVISSETEPQE